jgi:predicted CxxxxCH...CXXCH cytochrome family protein
MAENETMWPVTQAGAMKGCPVVKGRCPSCGNRTLGLGSGGYVTCANLRCHYPTLVSDALERGPGWLGEWLDLAADARARISAPALSVPTEESS